MRASGAFGLQPWRTETFKISPDPLLIDKIRDVVGLYLSPPANAAVFTVDEKPQIQALERTAPVLPMIPGVAEGKSFRIEQEIRLPDGTLVAEITNVGGLLDLKDRRLVRHPDQAWRSVASAPQFLGL